MEVVLHTGFGHKVDMINGQDDEMAEAARYVLDFTGDRSRESLITILSNFPFLEGYVRYQALKSEPAKNYMYLENKAEELINERLNNEHLHSNYQDLLQLLIDARADEDEVIDYQRKLSRKEILRLIVGFMAAGYDSTKNTLAYASYLLAINPIEQNKQYKNIEEFYTQNPEASICDAANNLTCIDMVISESQRIFPPAPITTRETGKNTTINGITFPQKSLVLVPIKDIHHSPDTWPDPFVFKPERFTKEEKEKRHPLSHMPFGYGPRSCIAMRLALMEAKMALIAILKEYEFVEAPDTEKPLKTSYDLIMRPINGVYLIMRRRNEK